MAVSTITQFTSEGFVLGTSGFVRSGVVYVLWSTAIGGGRKIQWRPHTELNPVEISGQLQAAFNNLSCITLQDNNLLVVWDDDTGLSSNGSIFQAVFNPLTGAVISGPTTIARGAKPTVTFLNNVPGTELVLSFTNRTKKSFYMMRSRNSATSWLAPVPVLSNHVLDSDDVVALPFDSSHVSVVQMGRGHRLFSEVASYSRTRPLSTIVAHPTIADRYYLAESGWQGANIIDHLRGGLVWTRDFSKILFLCSERRGTDDTIGAVALVNTASAAPALLSSATNAGATIADDLGIFTSNGATITAGSTTDLYTSGIAAGGSGLDVSDLYAYIAAYEEAVPANGFLWLYRISDTTNVAIASGLSGRAVSVAMPSSGPPVIVFCTIENSFESLRIYTEYGLTPQLKSIHRLPARANHVKVVMTSASVGTIYVSMVDRLNVYSINGLTSPIRLITSIPVMTFGQFFQVQVARNGNIIAAMGNAGVGVYKPSGEIVAHSPCAGVIAPEWKPSTVYAANALVRPRAVNSFAGQRYYFKTAGGTSGLYEPGWAKTGTMTDNTNVWTPQGEVDGWVTGLVVDSVRKRAYGVGVAGGPVGTIGRMWAMDLSKCFPKVYGHTRTADTVALWRFDEASGVAVDVTGTYNLPVGGGAPGTVNAPVGTGRSFAGTPDHFLFLNPATIRQPFVTGDFTVEGWVSLNGVTPANNLNLLNLSAPTGPTGPTANNDLFGSGIAVTTRFIAFFYTGCSILSTVPLPLGGWHHLAFRRSGTTNSIWMNGVKVGEALAQPQPLDGSNTHLYFGKYPTNTENWRGFVDDWRVSKVALTDAEIMADFLAGAGEL